MWSMDQPRNKPSAPPIPLTTSSKPKTTSSSSSLIMVFSAERKNAEEEDTLQSILSLLVCKNKTSTIVVSLITPSLTWVNMNFLY